MPRDVISPQIVEELLSHPKLKNTKLATLRVLVARIHQRNPGLTMNAASYVYAKAKDISLFRYLNQQDRMSLAYLKNGTSIEHASPTHVVSANPQHIQNSVQSKAIRDVIAIAAKYQIANIDQNWTDSLVILNFIETLLTKFLMDHGYSESQIEQIHWDDKITKVRDKLFQEAAAKTTKPRKIVLANLTNYRTIRNTIDHEAHLPDASIRNHEVKLLLNLLQALAKEIFQEHKSYCNIV